MLFQLVCGLACAMEGEFSMLIDVTVLMSGQNNRLVRKSTG